jgi:hypothetical protein
MTDRRSSRFPKTIEESRPKRPDFGLSPGRDSAGRCSAQQTYGVLAYGSKRVMEVGKEENPTPIFYDSIHRP